MVDLPTLFVESLNRSPPEAVWPLMLVTCFGAVVLLHRFFGREGLYVYIALAIVGANIQVLKAVQFSVYPEPVALGTILFSSSYFATDLLAELYGKQAARKGVWLGFAAYLTFTALMLITLGFRPLTEAQAGEAMAWAVPFHEHMAALFSPAPALFAAAMVAYLVSQNHDVWLFHWLREKTGGRFLWARNNTSTMLSALIDNTVFSLLAWIVFSANPLPLDTVVFTYILGTYWLRLLVAALDTPFIYLGVRWAPAAQTAD
jgi:uncharacterized integral membrane protein (TIGR00697 family)